MKVNFKKTSATSFLAACLLPVSTANAAIMTFDEDPSTWSTRYDTTEVDVTILSPVFLWNNLFNDLINVASTNQNQALVIDFVALAGSTVTLNSFDLGNFLGTGSPTQYSIYDIANLSVPVLSATDVNVAFSFTEHPTYDVNYSSTNGIRLVVGPDLLRIGLDNVNYSSIPDLNSDPNPNPSPNPSPNPIPEPTTLSLLSLGLAGLFFTRKQKKS